ncbi:MAG TPA: hypothetical protein VFA98_16260 [Thermoanaerobaculia bacterium]|nr:hypothetical protein [Thermoanaerobaculia bacterium]
MTLDDAILEKLAGEDDMPDFTCPECGGSFFSATPGPEETTYECDTVTDTFRCKWKGPAFACFLPSRATLAAEILALRQEYRNADILKAALAVGRARQVHEDAKSDPSRNVATGQAVYAAETHFDRVMREALKLEGSQK